MQVDLPQPVGPTRKTNSPRPIFIDARSSPTEPPSYTIVTSSISTTGTSRCGAPEPARVPVLSVRVSGIREGIDTRNRGSCTTVAMVSARKSLLCRVAPGSAGEGVQGGWAEPRTGAAAEAPLRGRRERVVEGLLDLVRREVEAPRQELGELVRHVRAMGPSVVPHLAKRLAQLRRRHVEGGGKSAKVRFDETGTGAVTAAAQGPHLA